MSCSLPKRRARMPVASSMLLSARHRAARALARTRIGVVLCVGLGAGACTQPESTKLTTQPPPHVRVADVVEVSPRPQSHHLVLVEPARRARLAPRVGGQLIELLVDEQEVVEEGALLARLAAQDSRGGLMTAKGSIDRIREALRDNASELKTARGLAAKGAESARAVERLETTRTTLRAQLRESKGQLLRAKDAVVAGTIQAPFAGTITKIETEVGEYLAPSSAAIVLAQLDPIAVQVPLSERQVALHDQGGLSFAVTIRAERFESELEWIASEADTGTSTFPARLLIGNPMGRLRAGESAQVEVFGPRPTPQTAVPMTAVRWVADTAYVLRIAKGAGGGAVQASDSAAATEANGVVERVDVAVLGDSDALVIVQGPLSAGDTVVFAGPTRLVDGDAVVVVKPEDPTLAAR